MRLPPGLYGLQMALFGRRNREPEPEPEPEQSAAPGRAEAPPPARWSGRALQLPVRPSLAAMPELAESILEPSKRFFGVTLGYEVDDLDDVDRILNAFHVQGSEAHAEHIFCFGAYVGETMVRHAGGRWIDGPATEGTRFPFVIRLPRAVVCNPLGRAFRRVDEGLSASIPYFYRAMVDQDAQPDDGR